MGNSYAEQDYMQEQLDGALREIFGEATVPFAVRHPYIRGIDYTKKEEMTEMANSGKGVRIPMRTRGRPRRHKPRLCRCCGREMEPTQIWICASCEAAGRTIPRARGVQSGAELLAIARAREAAEEPILEGWGLDEIEALARYLWDNGTKAYGTYGKLRGWCDNVGWLPPLPEGL